MLVREAVDEYRYAVLRLSPHTQRWYVQKLRVFADYCDQQNIPLESLRITHIRLFLESLKARTNPQTGKPLSTYTLHGYAQVIKGFLTWCTKEDGLDDVVPERLPKRIDMPKVDTKVIEIFTPDHIRAMLFATEKEYNYMLTVRDKAIVSVLLDTGIRLGELVGLTLECCFLYPNDAFLKVFGKGNKWREVPLGNESLAKLRRYITRYRKPARQDIPQVFLSRHGTPMTPKGVDEMLVRLGEWGKVDGVRVSAHTFRRTFAVNYLLAGGDLYRLSRLMGHSGVHVTERYLQAMKQHEARKNSLSVMDSMHVDTVNLKRDRVRGR